ncbi:HNH endonuclease signature motif containing protein [Klenkia taihuensis]|uniref:HNH nuclease domain-containing protein n=1 Tax=Klenkia taihuensis TaxID=1225127 RepID=A0A1I1QD78_9ACTN|nr:HNH endonuclease signature motif containing protein [Klenkia taihuensis]GHE08204.1 hypothetical protein GCM10011381_08060 [Klenkia taihuensis]SFD16070.1 protein of unknown function [Klenkia taihuensis]
MLEADLRSRLGIAPPGFVVRRSWPVPVVLVPPPGGWRPVRVRVLPGADDGLAAFRAGLDADAALLDVARAAQRTVGAAQAEQARALAAFAARRPAALDLPDDAVGSQARDSRARRPDALTTVSEFCVDEVAAGLTLTTRRAEQLLTECVLLVERLPLVLAALDDGRITWDHVRVACDLLGGLSPELRDRAQAGLVGRAGGRTASDWRPVVRRWVMKADAEAITRRVAQAVRDRSVAVHPGADGMATLAATLPLPVARAVEDCLRGYARGARTPDDDRSAGERMADCLVALVLDPGAHGVTAVQAEVTVVVALQTLLGGDEPGEVSGDVVPAAMVRDLLRSLGLLRDGAAVDGEAIDAGLAEARGKGADAGPPARLLAARRTGGIGLAGVPRIAVADEQTGELAALTDVAGLRRAARDGSGLGPPPSAEAYRPCALLDVFVRLRDRRCRFPGCRVRARVCDVDHQQPRSQGGETAECNLACLCTHHHRLSHQAPGWTLSRERDGTGLTWVTPTGQTISTRPPPVLGWVDEHEPARPGGAAPAAASAATRHRRDAVRGLARGQVADGPPPF